MILPAAQWCTFTMITDEEMNNKGFKWLSKGYGGGKLQSWNLNPGPRAPSRVSHCSPTIWYRDG